MNDARAMKRLLDGGFKLNEVCRTDGIPFTFFGKICTRNAPAILRLCLEGDYGVNVNGWVGGVADLPPLALASRYSQGYGQALGGPSFEMMHLLVEHGANADWSSEQGSVLTCLLGNKDMPGVDVLAHTHLLVEAGADVNYEGRRPGTTPLASARRSGQMRAARYLMARGAQR